MADVAYGSTSIGWGRTPDGRFTIQIVQVAPLAEGQVVQVPFMVFILSKEEEVALRAALGGLLTATGRPRPKLEVLH